jgi:sugar phosphate isomerase/epimerase
MINNLTRRQWLIGSSSLAGHGLSRPEATPAEPFLYGLNTSTLMGQKLDLVEIVEIAAKAGYQALEPWISELDRHAKRGDDLKSLGERIRDRGLRVESAIGFFEWAVDDETRRRKAMEEAKRSMELVQQIGGKRLAAPPSGATNVDTNLLKVAERYRALLELGDRLGVVPEVEFWGSSRTLGRLGEAALVALECGHPKACILADVYHLYKGGSQLAGLQLLSGSALHVIHMNDYPADPPRNSITDAHRVYPGDGVAPLKTFLRDLHQIGFRGVLSLELFNRDYWKQDALSVAKMGLEKMQKIVRASLE